MASANLEKKIKIASIVVIAGLVLTYLAIVFLSSVSISTYHGISARPGYTLPELTGECLHALAEADLHPYGYKIRHPEFREYANIWLWDGAKTLMYDKSVLLHPACLNYLLQRTIAAKQRLILVIYDRQAKCEALVIRNYASIDKSKRR